MSQLFLHIIHPVFTLSKHVKMKTRNFPQIKHLEGLTRCFWNLQELQQLESPRRRSWSTDFCTSMNHSQTNSEMLNQQRRWHRRLTESAVESDGQLTEESHPSADYSTSPCILHIKLIKTQTKVKHNHRSEGWRDTGWWGGRVLRSRVECSLEGN